MKYFLFITLISFCVLSNTQKIELNNTAEEILNFLNLGSPIGFTERNGHYYKVPTITLRWGAAQSFCERLNTSLAIINTPAEAEAVHEIINSTDVINSNTTNVWVGSYYSDGKWIVVDGNKLSDVSNVPWRKMKKMKVTDLCGTIRSDNQFNVKRCHKKLPFICETEVPQAESNSIPPALVLNGWRYYPQFGKFKSHRYVAIINHPRKWKSARNACKVIGARLARLNKVEDPEAKFLHSLIRRAHINDPSYNSPIWANSPNTKRDRKEKKKCGVVDATGQYSLMPCNSSLEFVCKWNRFAHKLTNHVDK